MRRQNFQTIAWFYDLNQRGLLNLDPPYQRRSVWNQVYKDYFIDTILLDYPAPAIFLYEEISDTGVMKYNVVDGKQRLTTIFEFIKGEFPVYSEVTKQEFKDKYFEELENKSTFYRYTFSVEYLSTIDESIINNIFDRINKNVAKLTSQELRHAKYSGEFITACEEQAEWMFNAMENNLLTIPAQRIKQMRDVEFVSQLLLINEDGYRGYSSTELDMAFADKDSFWEKKNDSIKKFQTTINTINDMLQDIDSEKLQILRERFKNQADFYSLFGAIQELMSLGTLPPINDTVDRLVKFIEIISDNNRRSMNQSALQYYNHARTASNRTLARKERNEILKNVILGNI